MQGSGEISSPSRRGFIGKVGAAAVTAGVLGGVPAALAEHDQAGGSGASDPRVRQSYNIRLAAAIAAKNVPVPPHTTNGDELRYPDKSATYTKGLLQDDIGVVNKAAYESFKKALRSGKNEDFEAMIIGGTRTQNDIQAAYAFDLEGGTVRQRSVSR